MGGDDQLLRFELTSDEDENVLLWFGDTSHILGPKVSVCAKMGRFLAEAGFALEQRFLGLTIDEWDLRWVPSGPLTGKFSRLNRSVGLYRALLDGEVMYIGRAYEHANGGFRKRLSDYTRASDSSRKDGAGPLMFEHRNQLTIDVLVTGGDAEAATAAVQMEHLFIRRYDPPWNQVGRQRAS